MFWKLNFLFHSCLCLKKKSSHEPQLVKCLKKPKIEQKSQVRDYEINCEKAQSQGIGFLFFYVFTRIWTKYFAQNLFHIVLIIDMLIHEPFRTKPKSEEASNCYTMCRRLTITVELICVMLNLIIVLNCMKAWKWSRHFLKLSLNIWPHKAYPVRRVSIW